MITRRYGQLEAELQPTPAAAPFTLSKLFFVSVGSGLTIWLLTRWLERRIGGAR